MRNFMVAIFVVLALIIGLVIGYLAGDNVAAFNRDMIAEGELQPPLSHGVGQNDTLWGIADRYYPGYHTGNVVHVIRQMNPELDPGNLQPGRDVVLLPRLEDVR